jgi:Cu-Zn family superoxide dismutase
VAVGLGFVVGDGVSAQSAGAFGSEPRIAATASLQDAQGRPVGSARLQQTPHGVLVKIELTDVSPGTHAIHVHDVGRCEGPTFDTAGGHVSPPGRQHGFLNPRGHHAGDLPNVNVPASKQLTVEQLVADVTLDSGPQSLLDDNGSAVVIHAGSDDYATDPAGDSGPRIACGRIIAEKKP